MSDSRTFSVVETFEHGVRCFSACPSTWINGKTLSWPTSKQLSKARRQYERPQAHWQQCDIVDIVKTNINSLELALASEKSCLNGSSEDARRQQKVFKRKHPVLSVEQTDNFSLNKKFQELTSKTPKANDGKPTQSYSQTTPTHRSLKEKFQELASKTKANIGKPTQSYSQTTPNQLSLKEKLQAIKSNKPKADDGKPTQSYSRTPPNDTSTEKRIRNTSQNKRRSKKQRIDSDDSSDGELPVQETGSYVENNVQELDDSDEVDNFDIEGICTGALTKIANFKGN